MFYNRATSKRSIPSVEKHPYLGVFELENPTEKFTLLERYFRLLKSTSQGKAGAYNTRWYVTKVLNCLAGNTYYNVLTTSTVERQTLDNYTDYTQVSSHVLNHYEQNKRQWALQGAKTMVPKALRIPRTKEP